MKPSSPTPSRRNVHFVVNRKDPRVATVIHDGKTLFTIKTDVSGMHPSIVVVAAVSHLKMMTKGSTGVTLWNGTSGSARGLDAHAAGRRARATEGA